MINYGSYGLIYLCMDKQKDAKTGKRKLSVQDDRAVICKVIPKAALNDKLIKQMKEEINLQKQMQSNYIPKIIKMAIGDSYLYLFMPYCNGMDLR